MNNSTKQWETGKIIVLIIYGLLIFLIFNDGNIISGIFLLLLWILLFLIYKPNFKGENNIQEEEKKLNNDIQENTSKIDQYEKEKKKREPIETLRTNVHGITFQGRTKSLELIIKKGYEYGYLEKYDGWSNKDIIEFGNSIGEYDGQMLEKVKLEKYKYKGQNAIRVLISDWDNNFFCLGNIPEEKVNYIYQYLDNNLYNIQTSATITGGKFKKVDIDDKIYIEKLNYGVFLNILIYKK